VTAIIGIDRASIEPGKKPSSLKDSYPDRAIIYSFLLGILVLGVGFIFSFLVNDDRFIPRRILLQVFDIAPSRDVRAFR
jgi:hypothetical protein